MISHPRDAHGNVDLRAHARQQKADPLEDWRRLYRSRNWPEWRIEAKVREFLSRRGEP